MSTKFKPIETARRPAGVPVLAACIVSALVSAGCASSDSDAPGFKAPAIPAAKSALLPPELTLACPIVNSSIDSLVTKGTGTAFNGASFGSVGTYKYILAEATGKVSSKDPCAPTIVDLQNVAPDGNGFVSYSFDVVILTPTDPAKASGTLLYEVNNRTNTPSFAALNDGTGQNLYDNTAPSIPATSGPATSGVGAGSGFLMKQGMTIVWSGWQGDRPQSLGADVTTAAISNSKKWYAPGMTLPVAVNLANNKATLTGTVQDELVPDSSTATSNNVLGLYYQRVAGTPATLTIRRTPFSAPIEVDPALWTHTDGSAALEGGNTTTSGYGFVTIKRAELMAAGKYAAALDAGKDHGSIYQFNYTAKNPRPFGLGFLGVRDLISFLRSGTQDKAGNANPLAGQVKVTLATGISQSGRFLRDFLWQGFNTDAQLKTVFDGMMPLVGGSRKTYTNYRWAKPGDYSRQHETHYTPGDQFPFGYATLTDPLSGKTDGLLKKCTELNTCPKVFQYDSPIEFGGARASLTVTDGIGRDVAIPGNVRMFYAPGTSHGPQQLASNASSQPDYSVDRTVSPTAVSALPGALVASTAMYRALLLNLEGWVKGTATPLASNFPKVADGGMALPTSDPASLGSPDLSALGLAFNGVYNTLSLNDESVIPSVPSNQYYVVHQPTSDAQGNERAGVKMPDIAVPLATFKGYSLRRTGFVAGDQNGLNSSQLAFALSTAAKRAGDPRKSVQELYTDKATYLAQWNASVDALVRDGFMLTDDAQMYKNRGVMQTLQTNFATLP